MRSLALATLVSIGVLAAMLVWDRRADDEAPRCACQTHEPASTTAPSGTAALRGDSIYQVGGTFTDQDGHPFVLTSLRGAPVLIAMFYASCTTVCPLTISEIRRVEQTLSEADRARLRVVLVTFDTERDTPERLRALATEHALPTPRWTLLRADDDDVRELAMVLGVQYRRIEAGDFVHSALVTLLDTEGTVVAQLDGLDAPLEPFDAHLREVLASHE
jgi:protein SCO1/2